MKRIRIISGLLAAALILSAPGAIQAARAVSANEAARSSSATSSYQVKVTANSLTIRAKADKSSAIKGYLSKGDKVTIVDESVDSRGYTWGKLKSGDGWISLRFTDWSGSSSFQEYDVEVTANSLTIRAKANKDSAVKGYLAKGKVVTIVNESVDSRGYTWGQLENGYWISLRFTDWAGSSSGGSSDTDSSTPVDYKVRVTADTLTIRSKPTKSSASKGVLDKDDIVRVVAQDYDENGDMWVKLADGSGWIYRGYTKRVTDSSSSDSYDVKVTVNSLFIRVKPDKDSASVGFLRKGNVMTIVDEKTDDRGYLWGLLENGDGWISLRYTTKVNTTPDFAQYRVKITVNSLRIRASASSSSAIVGGVTKGEIVTIVAEKGGWGKLKSGAGWIWLEYTKRV